VGLALEVMALMFLPQSLQLNGFAHKVLLPFNIWLLVEEEVAVVEPRVLIMVVVAVLGDY
jgi:hypothetical protein